MNGILDAYYRFDRKFKRTKTTLICTASTHNYSPFERQRITKDRRATERVDAIKSGMMISYVTKMIANEKSDPRRTTDLRFSLKDFISSIYVPNLKREYGYGDYNGDALLFVLHDFGIENGVVKQGAIIEVFVAKGQGHNCKNLYTLLYEEELEEELERLRNASENETFVG